MTDTSRPPRLLTARYQNPSLATHPAGKVRITLGAPRFSLPYPLAAKMPELAPPWWILKEPEPAFAIAYRRLLQARGGVDYFAERFTEIAQAVDVDELVLLCFEDLRTPGAWCHRRLFAGWWENQTGQVVEEMREA